MLVGDTDMNRGCLESRPLCPTFRDATGPDSEILGQLTLNRCSFLSGSGNQMLFLLRDIRATF